MELKNKLFPYPVMSKLNNDYTVEDFDTFVEVNKNINSVDFEFKYELRNLEINYLIKNDYFDVIFHIECSKTGYREIIRMQNNIQSKAIESKYITGRVIISSYIVAKKNLENYTNSQLNEDYDGYNFTFAKGNVVAIGDTYNIDIEKEVDDLGKVPSVFSIIRLDVDDKNGMLIEIENDKIQIKLDTETYNNYRLCISNHSHLPIVNSCIILPALIFALENLKSSFSDFEEYAWFKSIRNKLKLSNIDLDELYLKSTSSYEIAQRILDLPVSKALESLMVLGSEDE